MPETPATVTRVFILSATLAEETMRHDTDVPLVHEEVIPSKDTTTVVGVLSMAVKERPVSVADEPPVEGALPSPARMQLTDGAAIGEMIQ